jgi:ankyrin repeat protein
MKRMKRNFFHHKPKEASIVEIQDAGYDYELGYTRTLKRLLPHILRKELEWGEVVYDYGDGCVKKMKTGRPILFSVAVAGVKTLEFLESKKVDFLQADSDGNTLLHHFSHEDVYDMDVFVWVLDWFKKHGCIDVQTNDGFTALSGAIKFGTVNKAGQLLAAGANPMIRAESAYQGGKGLTPWTQAIICLDGEEKGIECMTLLASKSKPDADSIMEMLEDANAMRHMKMVKWIEENLLSRI